MITIWKLTISSFRLSMLKFSKISFTKTVDQNAAIKLHKRGKSNIVIAKRLDMNRSMEWKIAKKFQEIGNTIDGTGRGRKQSVRSPQLLKNTVKSCDETLAEAAEPWPPQPLWANPPCSRCWGTIWRWSPSKCSIARSFRTIMLPWGPKNAGKSSRRWPTVRCRTSCLRTRRNSTSSR